MSLPAKQQAINIIQNSKRILVTTTRSSTGDSLASLLATVRALSKMGKEVEAVIDGSVPANLKFLTGNDQIKHNLASSQDTLIFVDLKNNGVEQLSYNIENDQLKILLTAKKQPFKPEQVKVKSGQANFDLIIVTDTADVEQLGKIYEANAELFYNVPVLNIDHKAANEAYGKINLVEPAAAATTEILFELFAALDPKVFDEDLATLLLAGINASTESFQNNNTTPRAFSMASKLISLGARQQEIVKNIYKTRSLATLKLWGRALARLKVDREKKLLWSLVSADDFTKSNSTPANFNEIMEELMSNAPQSEIFLLIYQYEGTVRCRVFTPKNGTATKLGVKFQSANNPVKVSPLSENQKIDFATDFKDLTSAEKSIIEYIKGL